MSDLRRQLADAIANYYGYNSDMAIADCVESVMRLVAEDRFGALTESRDELARVYRKLNVSADEAARLRAQLADAVKERDLHARNVVQLAQTRHSGGGALEGWDGSPTIPGGVPPHQVAEWDSPTPKTVAMHLTEAHQALDETLERTDLQDLRTALVNVIAAVEALAGGAPQ